MRAKKGRERRFILRYQYSNLLNMAESTTKKHILVAEDDKFYANIYKVKLAKEGFDVEVVGNGSLAIDSAKMHKPDLILLDLVMPVKDGFETLKELRANPDFANVKIVILSSLGQDEDAKRARELGASDFFVKTNVTIEEMVRKVREYLGS